MKRIKPQYFLILLLVAALAAAPFLIRGLIDRSNTGKQPAASVTAAPEETAAPTPTPEPTPLQFTTVDASYFDDALFIGDSRTVGIAEYGNLRADASGDSTHVYAKYDLDWCDWLCTKAIVR